MTDTKLQADRRIPLPDVSTIPPDEPGGINYRAYETAAHYDQQISMLEFRFRDGSRTAMTYHFLVRTDCQPSEGLTLTFTDLCVVIRGRNLGHLFTLIQDHEVKVVFEADRATAQLLQQSNAVIEAIELRPIRSTTKA